MIYSQRDASWGTLITRRARPSVWVVSQHIDDLEILALLDLGHEDTEPFDQELPALQILQLPLAQWHLVSLHKRQEG